VKVARTVRRGAVGKVPLDGNSLAAYPTLRFGEFRMRSHKLFKSIFSISLGLIAILMILCKKNNTEYGRIRLERIELFKV